MWLNVIWYKVRISESQWHPHPRGAYNHSTPISNSVCLPELHFPLETKMAAGACHLDNHMENRGRQMTHTPQNLKLECTS